MKTPEELTNETIGTWGEATAAAWFSKNGYKIAYPKAMNNRGWDFIIEKNGEMKRVQVKASAYYRMGRPEVCIMGGGKILDTTAFDLLFAVHMVGRARLYPAHDVPKKSVSFGVKVVTKHKYDICL